jgi:hypothetical protein
MLKRLAYPICTLVLWAVAGYLVLGGSPSTQSANSQSANSQPAAQKTPAPKDLYHRAAVARVPDYTIAHEDTNNGDGKRVDIFVITSRTDDKAALGSILEDVQLKTDADLVVAYFFDSKTAYQHEELFADGQLAAKATGESFREGEPNLSKISKFPMLKVTLD